MAGGRAATIGTTSAFRVLTYQMGVFLKFLLPNDLPLEDSVFPLVVDSVMIALRGITIPVQITDTTVGGWPSTITHFGEDLECWYGNIHASEDQRLWLYEAEIRNTIKEHLQQ